MKLLVYPMNKVLAPLARYSDMLLEYEQVIPVAPKSFGYGTQDIAICDGGREAGICCRYDLTEALSEADAVLVDYCPSSSLKDDRYLQVIKSSVETGKRVYVTDELRDFLVKNGHDEIQNMPLKILEYNKDDIVLNDEKRLLELPVPCIFVLGTGDLTNKFDIQLGLRKAFQEAGYTVTQLGTKKYSSLFGFAPLPDFIMESGDSHKQVLDFNHYVYEKVKREAADVVIIGIPDGIMPNNPYEFTDFGEKAFLIGNALKADAAVLSLYGAEYPTDTLQILLNICKYRFNAPVRYVNLACNDMVVSPETLLFQNLSLSVDYTWTKILPQIKSPVGEVFVAMEPKSMERLAKQIMMELESNI